jgi:hypothetical protein
MIKKGREIASGFEGTVYECTWTTDAKKVDAVLKIEHVLERNVIDALKMTEAFAAFTKAHPQHFLQILHVSVINDRTFKHARDFGNIANKRERKDQKKRYKAAHATTYCLQTVMTPRLARTLQDTLEEWHKALRAGRTVPRYAAQSRSFLSQVYDMYDTMSRAGWSHDDLHTRNIMCDAKNTLYCIDYSADTMYHKDFGNKHFLKNAHLWLVSTLHALIYQPWWPRVKRLGIYVPSQEELAARIRKSPDTKHLAKYLPKIKEPETIAMCLMCLCVTHHVDKFLTLFGLTDSTTDIALFNAHQALSAQDITFVVKNLTKYRKVMKYLQTVK